MRCPCPKCDVTIEVPAQVITADGSSQRCPECNDKYWTRQEKFMLRAYKKQGRVYCFGCGHELGGEHYCVQCGSLCPDYAIVQSTRFVAQKKQKSGLNFSLARRPKSAKVIAVSQGFFRRNNLNILQKRRPTGVGCYTPAWPSFCWL